MNLLLALVLAQPMNLNVQPPSTFRCDGGIACSVSGRTLYISGSGSSSGSSYDGGKVGEAYMADASITAQVASVAYSSDASYISIISGTANVAYSSDASYSSVISGTAAVAYSSDASYSSIISGTANVAYSADAGYYSTEFIVNPSDCSANQYATTIAANGNLTCSQVTYSQVSGTPSIYNQTIEDEATPLTQRTNVNFTGAGVSCADTGGKTVCTINGGSGSVNVVEVQVDFGASGDTTVSTVVTGQAWVTGTSKIICSPTMLATTDRSEGMEDVVVEEIVVAAHTRVAGVGFTVTAGSAQGRAIGKFIIHCTGA